MASDTQKENPFTETSLSRFKATEKSEPQGQPGIDSRTTRAQTGSGQGEVLSSNRPHAPFPASSKDEKALEDARAHLEKNDFAGALAIYDRILDHNGKNIFALSGKQYVLKQTGQNEAAAEIHRQIVKLSPSNADEEILPSNALSVSDSPSVQTDQKQ